MMHTSHATRPFNIDPKSEIKAKPGESLMHLRRLGATLCGIGAATVLGVLLGSAQGDPPIAIFVPSLFMVLAAFALHTKVFALQVFARSAFWSNLLFALVLCFFGSNLDDAEAVAFLLLTGSTLLFLGRDRLDQHRGQMPIAFQGTLVLTLLFAFADIQSLLFWSVIFVDESRHLAESISLLVACASMCFALWGILKLKIWGLALNLFANFSIAACAIFLWDLPMPIVFLLSSTALIQLFLSTPLWLNIFGIRSLTFTPSERFKSWVPNVTVITLMVSGLVFFGSF